jgi:hypothetical protein
MSRRFAGVRYPVRPSAEEAKPGCVKVIGSRPSRNSRDAAGGHP